MGKPEKKEVPRVREAVKASREVTGAENIIGVGYLVFAAIVPIATSLWWGRPKTFPDFITLVFVGIYMFSVLVTFAIIVLWGLGRLDLPGKFVHWLGTATIGEVTVFVWYLIRHISKG